MRRRAQRQHERAPENAERREHQQRDRAPHAQRAFVAQQRRHRAQQRRIADPFARCVRVRQEPRQHDEHRDRERPRHEIDGTPAGDVGHRARDRTRGQQPDHDAALRGADHAAAFAGARQCGRAGDQSLRHRGAEQADRHHADEQREACRRGGDADAGRREQHELDGEQPLAIQPIAERHDEQQRERTAELRGRDDRADRGGRHREVA
ncbi:hypothetical protein FEP65_02875 [Burkholderia multivorans]|nr:hypothetical protein [Burkholderia multivorans]